MISERAVERLFLYRRILQSYQDSRVKHVFSHDLANLAGVSSEQVRRDLMEVECIGSKRLGYEVAKLLDLLEHYFNTDDKIKAVLIGVGNLGRALLAYFAGKRSHISIEACFDNDKSKSQRTIHGCHCFALDGLRAFIEQERIKFAIIAVPGENAQQIADILVKEQIRAIVNFAPSRIIVPKWIVVENVDITLSIEKVCFLADLVQSQIGENSHETKIRGNSKEL